MSVPYAEVIGDPVDHSKSPLIHRYWLERLGIEGDYRSTRVRRDELRSYFESRRADPDWRGCNVTLPHKQAILPLLDRLEDDFIGAVNCVVAQAGRLTGVNTDKAGIERIFEEVFRRDVEITAPICLIGAGGAALAGLAALSERRLNRVNLIVRDSSKGERILVRFGMTGTVHRFAEARRAMAGAIGLVNATPLGMTGAPAMPASILSGIDGLHRDAFVFDMVYAPAWTAFLERAAEAGLETVNGLEMLIGQAERAFFHFYGRTPPAEYDTELRALIRR